MGGVQGLKVQGLGLGALASRVPAGSSSRNGSQESLGEDGLGGGGA